MKSRTLLRTTALSLAAILALGACNSAEEPPETPTPTPTTPAPTTTAPTPPSPTPDPTTSEPADPTGEPAPPLPDEVGDWEADPMTSSDTIADYNRQGTEDWITASMWEYMTKERLQERATDSLPVGDWLCGQRPDNDANIYCSADVWDGAVQLVSRDLPVEELAAFGDELLAAWS